MLSKYESKLIFHSTHNFLLYKNQIFEEKKKKRTKAMKEKMCHLIIIWVTFDNILSCSTIIHFDSSLFFLFHSSSTVCVMIENKKPPTRVIRVWDFSNKTTAPLAATFWSLVEFRDVDWLSQKLSYVFRIYASNNHKSN